MPRKFHFRSFGYDTALGLFIGGLALLGAACSSSKRADSSAIDAGADGPIDTSPASWNISVVPPSDTEAASQRAACAYTAGTLSAATQGASVPDGSKIPIDTIVIVMKENRSFDHYFQDLPSIGITDVDVAPSGASNPGVDGNSVPQHPDTTYCFADTDHGWAGTHQQINDGGMNGFAIENDGTHEQSLPGVPADFLSGARAMTYYKSGDLPLMYWAAQNFAIGDRYFASAPGPTWVNTMYLYAATSFGNTDNVFIDQPTTTILDYLSTRGVTWRIYSESTPRYGVFIDNLTHLDNSYVKSYSDFQADSAAGTLPQVSFVDPNFDEGPTDDDDHPPSYMAIGQAWLADVVSKMVASPQWPHAALFINYDEHGGLYDHVPPPKACPPDSIAPIYNGGNIGGFDEYGVRVPFVVVSPYAKKGYVSHQIYDHTSVTRFVEARFRLPAMTARDANALAPWDMFDFAAAPDLNPPAVPAVPIDSSIVSQCTTTFANVPSTYAQ